MQPSDPNDFERNPAAAGAADAEAAFHQAVANLASRKEVMPHTELSGDLTTPPQPSEAGVNTRIGEPDFAEGLCGFAAMCDRSLSIEDGPMLAAKFRAAATEIRRLRTTEAEQAARIAALEAGLRPFAKFWRAFMRKPIQSVNNEIYSIHPGTEFAAVLKLSDCVEAARLLPQEGK